MPASTERASDRAYQQLRDMLLDLRLSPGSVVNEHDLAQELEIGRMPVHEALARLAGEGFLNVLPRRGTVVTAFTLNDVLDLFEAREAIECGSTHLAARRATDEDIAKLEKLVAAADEARAAAHTEDYLRADYEIHLSLVRMLKNSLLADTVERLLMHNLRFWRFYFSSRTVQPTAMLGHDELLAGIRSRDGDEAERAMRRHICASRGMLQTLF
ncbi:MAG TPA: GntR family transcriptional regulator [Pseudonocardia sp.]|jgi:DNA-binding GntR family transcriptional regulator|uniref:GntR family transcriptional regulator n=1 Tax=Pseudonocardia sp. TaxID=60912 RepID=UPI002C10F1D5|nr:GntR family transcriptional regulator [Pseudonocardia sp.]HTF48063.1 GntR family transcriptional regulator [Pseudonocardia sp.]